MVAQAGNGSGTILFWLAVLILITVVLGAGILLLRQWMRRDDGALGVGWTLQELTELRDSGELTIQQYEHLRAQVIAEVKGVGLVDETWKATGLADPEHGDDAETGSSASN